MTIKLKVIFFSIFLIFVTAKANAQVTIKYKVNNQIITNIDIIEEKNYLIFLRPELKKLSDDELIKISGNSLIRKVIKKKELDFIFKNLNNLMYIEEIKNNLFRFKKVNNEEEFKLLLKREKVQYDKVLERIKYDALWNELIFKKYNQLVKIDRDKLKKKLKIKISNDKKYEYNLSEILFEVDRNSNLKEINNKIIKYIELNDFKTAASKFSISSSSNKGGGIGWVKETLLSEKLNNILKNMNTGEISKPISYPSGYLLLKINDKKELNQVLNFDEELKDLIRFEKNKQLNQFSLMHYKKLKQNVKINEY